MGGTLTFFLSFVFCYVLILMDDVQKLLESCKLASYVPNLEKEGYDDLNTLATLSKKEFNEEMLICGLNNNNIKVFWNALRRSNNLESPQIQTQHNEHMIHEKGVKKEEKMIKTTAQKRKKKNVVQEEYEMI